MLNSSGDDSELFHMFTSFISFRQRRFISETARTEVKQVFLKANSKAILLTYFINAHLDSVSMGKENEDSDQDNYAILAAFLKGFYLF